MSTSVAAVKRAVKRLWQPSESTDHNNHQFDSTSSLDKVSLIYDCKVEEIRQAEYPTLLGTTYLDHAGTTPYAKTALERWSAELATNLFGNPHSASASSQLSTRRVDDVRLKVLRFFNASPEDFDVVFVANATAAIKLVAEAFRDHPGGFWYGYHGDAHTSLVGCRELATNGTTCFETDGSVDSWVASLLDPEMARGTLQLLAYPGQSNMTGRRLPLQWCGRIRAASAKTQQCVYTLLDAASLVSTSPLDLSDASAVPDFIALSFYKIFGFPDLGALIVRRDSGGILMQKRYFAGGTVDAVVSSESGWHAKKASLHDALEEGTLPFHSILALDHAMAVHQELFGSMEQVSGHARFLAQRARLTLRNLRHANGARVCDLYGPPDNLDCGPLVAFNLKDSSGKILSASEVEKLCVVKSIQLRTGGLCNPGGIARHLGLSPDHIRANYNAGRRCGGENDMVNGTPTGALRVSFGAMSTNRDLEAFVSFIVEYYVERNLLKPLPAQTTHADRERSSFFIEALSVFPIKSCAAFNIRADQKWQMSAKGLAWDREWCLVHEGTNVALSQKRYPRMALLQPRIDLESRKLHVSCVDQAVDKSIEIDLDTMPPPTIGPARTCPEDGFRLQNSKVCGDTIPLHIYMSASVNNFFSDVLDVPCCLARYPRSDSSRNVNIRKPKSDSVQGITCARPSSMMLANESPMLIVSRSSVNELNAQIKKNAPHLSDAEGLRVPARSFRANIVVAPRPPTTEDETPYSEDHWTSVSIVAAPKKRVSSSSFDPPDSNGYYLTSTSQLESSSTDLSSRSMYSSPDLAPSLSSSRTSTSDIEPSLSTQPLTLDILGPCQRCQMVSINQSTAVSQQEPFSTLAKTRRKGDGRVWFGVHAALNASDRGAGSKQTVVLQVGDLVTPRIGKKEEDEV